MMQKDLLGQDMFLIGSPGPMRRRIALMYLVRDCNILHYDILFLKFFMPDLGINTSFGGLYKSDVSLQASVFPKNL